MVNRISQRQNDCLKENHGYLLDDLLISIGPYSSVGESRGSSQSLRAARCHWPDVERRTNVAQVSDQAYQRDLQIYFDISKWNLRHERVSSMHSSTRKALTKRNMDKPSTPSASFGLLPSPLRQLHRTTSINFRIFSDIHSTFELFHAIASCFLL